RRPRTEFYGTRSTLCSDSESLAAECLAHAPPARSLIDSHVFDPCSNSCRNAKHDEGQHPDDLATHGTIARQQKRGAWRFDHLEQMGVCWNGRRSRKLPHKRCNRLDEFGVHYSCLNYFDGVGHLYLSVLGCLANVSK